MNKEGAPPPSILENNVEVEGDITFTGELFLQGKVHGNILSQADPEASLVLDTSSEVNGEIRSPHLQISGKVIGDIHSSERVSLRSGSDVVGNIHYKQIHIEKGASINGALISLNNSA